MTQSFILFGKLRRDVMILETNDDLDHLQQTGAEAVATGRAQEAFIVPCAGYYLASDHNWSGIDVPDQHVVGVVTSTTSPPLNPGSGEQPPPASMQQSPLPPETPRSNQDAISAAGPKGPDTGKNPDMTPSQGALDEAEGRLTESDSPNPPTISVGEPSDAKPEESTGVLGESKPATTAEPNEPASTSSSSTEVASEPTPPPAASDASAPTSSSASETIEVPAGEAVEASVTPEAGASSAPESSDTSNSVASATPDLDAEIAAAKGEGKS